MFSLNMQALKLKLLKGKKSIFNAFIEIVNESNRKPNKLWVYQRR